LDFFYGIRQTAFFFKSRVIYLAGRKKRIMGNPYFKGRKPVFKDRRAHREKTWRGFYVGGKI